MKRRKLRFVDECKELLSPKLKLKINKRKLHNSQMKLKINKRKLHNSPRSIGFVWSESSIKEQKNSLIKLNKNEDREKEKRSLRERGGREQKVTLILYKWKGKLHCKNLDGKIRLNLYVAIAKHKHFEHRSALQILAGAVNRLALLSNSSW